MDTAAVKAQPALRAETIEDQPGRDPLSNLEDRIRSVVELVACLRAERDAAVTERDAAVAERDAIRETAGAALAEPQKMRDELVHIGAACKAAGTSFSRFISGLKKAGVAPNRKVLAEMALKDPAAFKRLVDQANAASASADQTA